MREQSERGKNLDTVSEKMYRNYSAKIYCNMSVFEHLAARLSILRASEASEQKLFLKNVNYLSNCNYLRCKRFSNL